MTAILIPQAKSSIFFLDLPVVNPKDLILSKKILEERTIAYNAFLNTLENLEEQTKKKIEELKKYPKQETQEQQDSLEKSLIEQKELLARLQSDEEKKIFDFILANHKNIFKVDPKKIKKFNQLNEKNFSRLLVLIYKKIRAEGLADEKSLEGGEIKKVSGKLADEKRSEGSAIKKVVDGRVDKARRAEAWDWFVGLKSKIPGVGFLRKMPGLEKILGKEEEEKKQLSEKEVATTFLFQAMWPFIILMIVILSGGLSGPMSVFGFFTIPHGIVIALAVFSFVTAEYKAIKGLFSNDEEFTSDGPDKSFSSHDKDVVNVKVQEQEQQKQEADKKQAEECGKRFSKKISDIILNTPVKETERSVQKSSEEVIATHPTQWQQSEDKRREAGAGQTLFRL